MIVTDTVQLDVAQSVNPVARLTRFERATSTFGGWHSIHLSYRRIAAGGKFTPGYLGE